MGANWCLKCNGSGFIFRLALWPFAKCPDCNGKMYATPSPRPEIKVYGQRIPTTAAPPPRKYGGYTPLSFPHCPVCNNRNKAEANFCGKCGGQIGKFA